MPLNIREICCIVALLAALGIAGITWEKRQQPSFLPAFGKPICPVSMPLPQKASADI